ncbi:MAG: metal ABC transporter permease [Patescibacteria group bacterium]|nr:metal ABC transporter permease [Patescibacteria group bacterium]
MIVWLALPFIQRAVLAGLILGALLAILGIFVVLRRMAFFSDGIAHASLAGVAVGVLANTNPLLTALGISAVLAVIMAWLERKTKIASDAIVGLIFTGGMATGVILLALKSGYQPELVSFLFGNILSIQWSELWLMVVLAALIVAFLLLNYKRLALMVLNPEIAHLSGVPVTLYQTLLYVTVAASAVLGIKMLGVALLSALLIVPVSTAKLIAKSFRGLMLWSVIMSELTVITGIALSIQLNLPTGAVIVLCGLMLFLLTLAGSKLFNR